LLYLEWNFLFKCRFSLVPMRPWSLNNWRKLQCRKCQKCHETLMWYLDSCLHKLRPHGPWFLSTGLNLIWAAIGKKSKIFWRTRRVNVFCMKEHCEEMKIYIWTNKEPRFCWVQILRDQYFSDGKVFFCKLLPTIFKQIIQWLSLLHNNHFQ
jgi:hypothetical protein